MRGCFLHISGDGILELNIITEAVNIPISKQISRQLQAFHDVYDHQSRWR